MEHSAIRITGVQELLVTETSYPFTSAARYGYLEGTGFTEREYQITGTANVYQTEADGFIGVRTPDAPYVNRIIVRAPADPANASGNVVVEIINPSSSMDIERMWILGYRKFLRDGDIYVGITSKPYTIARLKAFNPVRYGALRWPNPTPEVPFSFTEEALRKEDCFLPDCDFSYETGLFWDMLSDLAVLLRSGREDNPLKDYPVRALVLTGWSQSGDYLIRYLNDFAYRKAREKPLFDGYLPAGAPRNYPSPVNQYELLDCLNRDTVRIKRVSQPCIVLQTESENARMGAQEISCPDGDDPDYQVRHYDIAGASHDTRFTLLEYYQDDPELERIGMKFTYPGVGQEPNNYPTQFVVSAMFRNLFHWIESGTAPAPCPRIEVNPDGSNRRDALGSTVGGVRTCLLDLPSGRYFPTSAVNGSGTKSVAGIDAEMREDSLFGHEEPFSVPLLKELYGSLTHYETLVRENTFRQVTRGFILREDAEELVRFSIELAKHRGLR